MRADIIHTIGLDSTKVKTFIASTARRNLHYNIGFISDENDDRLSWLLTFLQNIYRRRADDPDRLNDILRSTLTNDRRPDAVSGIVYVSFRTECDSLAARLRSNNIGAVPYHAGLSTLERAECQQKWLINCPGYEIIVATTAFGMGIDKHDVRFVVHWTLPKSLEGYYQEAGRAGRDGKASLCMLFYSREDRDRVGYRINKDANCGTGQRGVDHELVEAKALKMKNRAQSFQELIKYCEQTSTCRHVVIGRFFGEQNVECCGSSCDYCWKKQGGRSLKHRKEDGLSSEEWVSTQRERDDFYGEHFD